MAVKCPSQSLSEDDLVTWETEEGELLGVGNEFLLGSVENSVNLVCRRRNFRTASMVSAVVHVRLNERSRSDGKCDSCAFEPMCLLDETAALFIFGAFA